MASTPPERRSKPITSQALETLANITLKQQVSTGHINAIRGVETLQNVELIARPARLGPSAVYLDLKAREDREKLTGSDCLDSEDPHRTRPRSSRETSPWACGDGAGRCACSALKGQPFSNLSQSTGSSNYSCNNAIGSPT